MALAETARLFSTLEMQDKGFTRTADKASRSLGNLEKNTKRMGGVTRNLGSSFGKVAGLLGVGLGVAGVTQVIRGAIDATTTMAESTRNFAAVTGQSVEQSSKWVDVLDKYGVSGDAATKVYARLLVNAGKFTATQKDATKFSKAYGLSLTDNHGKLVDANELLKRSADLFNSHATASQKATALTKLYGKGWQTLIPLLIKGRKGIEEEFGSALTLTPKQLKQMQELVEVQRDWNDTLGDTQVRVGVALIPTLTKGLKGLTAFFEANQGQIVAFAEGLSRGAEEVVAGIAQLAPVAKGIADAWNSIPPDFRKILIGGLVANKVLKMTIGFDPINIVREGVGTAIAKAVGGVLGRGSPGNPMYTKEVGLAGAMGGAGAAGGAGGLLGKVVGVTALVGSVMAVLAVQQEESAKHSQEGVDVQNKALDWLKTQPKREDLVNGLAAVDKGIADIRSNPLLVLVQGDALKHLEDTRNAIVKQMDQQQGVNAGGYKGFEARGPNYRPADAVMATVAGFTKMTAAVRVLHTDFAKQYGLLKTSRDPKVLADAATKAAADVARGVGSVATTKAVIATLRQQLAATKDPALRRVLQDALRRVERKLPGREWIQAQKDAATKIAKSNESVGEKVRDLKGIQQSLLSHGDTAAANIVGALLNGVVPAINNIKIPGMPAYLPQVPGTPRRNNNAPDVPIVTPRGARNPDKNQNRGRNVTLIATTTHRSNQTAADHKLRYSPDRQS